MRAPALPPALAPWAPWLRLFPADLASSMGPLIQRLSAALGPFAMPVGGRHGEPDGLSGLTRRGDYERLLVSEWLLAELVPDEFLRRAAASEHAFLRLERREPTRARTSVVLFDAGPGQLGGPRIAHLAALIALARRADVAHASLAWGVLHQPDAPLVTTTTRRDALRTLLARRTADAVGAEHWDAWRARLATEPCQDLWIVGGPAPLLRWPCPSRHIEIDEPITDGPAVLEATVRTTSRATRVVLPLPDGPSCVRLIRGPFRRADIFPSLEGERRTALIPDSELVITPTGERVFARARGGGVIVYAIPHSARGGVGRPKLRFREAIGAASAVAWHNRGLAALFIRDNGTAVLHHRPDRRASGDQRREYAHKSVPMVASRPLRTLVFRERYTVVHDGADKLYSLMAIAKGSPHANDVALLTGDFLAIAGAPKWFTHVTRAAIGDEPRSSCLTILDEDNPRPREIDLGGLPPQAAYFAHHLVHGCIAAIAYNAELWRLYGLGDTPREIRTTQRAIGLLAESRIDGRELGPALVTLADDRRTFLAHHSTAARRLTVAAEPVLHAVVSTVTGHLAYVTAQHTVVVLKPPHDVPLARFVVQRS